MLAAASAHFGIALTSRRVHLPQGAYVDVDGVADDTGTGAPAVFVEAFARQGALKGGQLHKVQGDVLKLELLARAFPGARLGLVFGDPVVASRVASGWLGEAVATFGIEIVVAELPAGVRSGLVDAQARQVMLNPPATQDCS